MAGRSQPRWGRPNSTYKSNSYFAVSRSASPGLLVAWTESITSPYELWFQVLGGGSTAYGYDGYDRLTDVSIGGSVVRSYAYDADGRRVRSYDGASGNMRYVYSGLNVLYEVPDGGGDATIRFYVGGLQVAERTGGVTTYLHQDHLGSTRLVTDAGGDVVYSSNCRRALRRWRG